MAADLERLLTIHGVRQGLAAFIEITAILGWQASKCRRNGNRAFSRLMRAGVNLASRRHKGDQTSSDVEVNRSNFRYLFACLPDFRR